MTPHAKKRKLNEGTEKDVEIDDYGCAPGLSFLLGTHVFKPLNLVAEWECPTSKSKGGVRCSRIAIWHREEKMEPTGYK